MTFSQMKEELKLTAHLKELYDKLLPFLACGHQGTTTVHWVPDIERENKKLDSSSFLLKAAGFSPYYWRRLTFEEFVDHWRNTPNERI